MTAIFRNVGTVEAATLERHAAELLDLPVDRVGKPEVLRALERVWTSQPGTGRKLRTVLRALFRHARAAGLIEVDPVAAVAGAQVSPAGRTPAHAQRAVCGRAGGDAADRDVPRDAVGEGVPAVPDPDGRAPVRSTACDVGGD